MKIGTKIVLIALLSVFISVAAALIIQSYVIYHQGVDLTRQTMRAAVLEAENVRDTISALGQQGAFDRAKLLAEYKKSGDLRGSTLYQTIPVVAAWQAIQKVADDQKWEFRVPKNEARNPKNMPDEREKVILNLLENGKTEEYFEIDKAKNQLVFARPIKLSADCLTCHGDPARSPTGDGKDLLGFRMEGWQAGQVHGAFVLRASLEPVQAVASAGMVRTTLWILPIAALVAILAAIFTQRTLIRPLENSISQIDAASAQEETAASEIASASQRLADGACQQSASLEETSAALEEISAMTRRNAEHAVTAQTIATQTREAADLGTQDMKQMIQAMNEIKTASDNISKIIKTIDEIAFQTNILALNAAVEAARAGEVGAGFAVVADEVRSLAQRSATAAKETADKIADSIRKSEHGVRVSDKVAKSLNEIAERARRMDGLVKEIASASSEQNQGIGQVNTAVNQLSSVTQTNAASAEECASASEQLSAQSATLKSAVTDLMRVVSGAEVITGRPVHHDDEHSAHPPAGKKTAPRVADGKAKKNADNDSGWSDDHG